MNACPRQVCANKDPSLYLVHCYQEVGGGAAEASVQAVSVGGGGDGGLAVVLAGKDGEGRGGGKVAGKFKVYAMAQHPLQRPYVAVASSNGLAVICLPQKHFPAAWGAGPGAQVCLHATAPESRSGA